MLQLGNEGAPGSACWGATAGFPGGPSPSSPSDQQHLSEGKCIQSGHQFRICGLGKPDERCPQAR